MKAPILRAVYRNGNDAVHVDVHDIFSDRKFGSGMNVYDIRKHVNRGGKKYRFEKFIPAKGASIFRYTRRDLTTGLGKTETETFQEVHEKMAALIDNQTHSYPGVSKPRQAVGAKTFLR